MGDVVLGEAERVLQHELLEHGGVEAGGSWRSARRARGRRSRVKPSRRRSDAPALRPDSRTSAVAVATLGHDARRRSTSVDARTRAAAPPRAGARRVVVEAARRAGGSGRRQARDRTSRPGTSARSGARPRRRPPRRRCAPSRSGGGRRRSGARRRRAPPGTRSIAAGSVDAPQPVQSCRSSSVTSPHGSAAGRGLERRPRRARGVAVEREDRRQVRARGAHQLQAVLLGGRVRALVRADRGRGRSR